MSGSTVATGTAFEDFYRSRAPSLLRYAVVVAGPASAEDACQDAWLRMWRAWGTAEDCRLDAWARQVVRNCCLDRRMAHASAAPATAAVDQPDPDPEPEELVLRRAEAAALGAHVRRLPAHLRDVLWFREMVGLSYAEIALALDIPVGTVMSRLHAARKKLARRLAG
ncbi:MAG TPA: sigma-70 family RNA polymerase sigma factor [Acidimicrobiales bacterium]|nr:sigma-70 family RNA polymerase sigma factor [Acidimicrobiales bacterium]